MANDLRASSRSYESVLAEGHASKTGRSRWEDSTNIFIDPSDNHAFWLVGNYLKTSATSSIMRIASFILPGCK